MMRGDRAPNIMSNCVSQSKCLISFKHIKAMEETAGLLAVGGSFILTVQTWESYPSFHVTLGKPINLFPKMSNYCFKEKAFEIELTPLNFWHFIPAERMCQENWCLPAAAMWQSHLQLVGLVKIVSIGNLSHLEVHMELLRNAAFFTHTIHVDSDIVFILIAPIRYFSILNLQKSFNKNIYGGRTFVTLQGTYQMCSFLKGL